MKRIKLVVTLAGIYEFATYYGRALVHNYIYKMVDESGSVYVWKTSKYFTIEVETDTGSFVYEAINKGDMIEIEASVKGESEYKGERQTDLSRVKVTARLYKAETPEERKKRIAEEIKATAQEQRESLTGNDFIARMSYKNYKEHYSDCETISGSYEDYPGAPATIEVIIREGRLKASGVRGEHYYGFELENEKGERVTYRAVKEENAIKRAAKNLGGSWKCVRVYNYGSASLWRGY